MNRRLIRNLTAALMCIVLAVTMLGCKKTTLKTQDATLPVVEQTQGGGNATEDEGETSPLEQPTKDNGDESTDSNEPTKTDEDDKEDSTQKPEQTEQEQTEKPTEKPTKAPTEPPTEPSTEPPTVSPTEPPTVSPTEPPTEPPTVPPTEPPTEPPTVPPTEPSTKEPVVVGGLTFTDHSYDNIRYYTPNGVSAEEIAGVRNVLSSIITAGMTDVQKIKAAHDWLVLNTTYLYSYYNRDDAYNFVYNLIYNKIAVCQGYATTFYVMMTELNIPCTIISGSDHAWNAVKLDGYWYYVDVTWDDPIINGRNDYTDGYNTSYEYLLCTYEHISRSRTTETYRPTEPTPNGTSDAYNDQMYILDGYKAVFRINSESEIDTVASQITTVGSYVIILENDSLVASSVYSSLVSKLQVYGAYSASYSDTSISLTIQ